MAPISRIQFIEIHEQAWCPSFLRDQVTDALQAGLNLFSIYAPIAPLLQKALQSTHARKIVDMCSGGGGPWLDLSPRLNGNPQSSLQILLTDKYPNLTAFENTGGPSSNHITFYPKPVDVMSVPAELKGFRTMFTSFHHFPPDEARGILQDAIDASQPIGIFEVTRRAPTMIALMFPWILISLLYTPWIRPFRWSRLLFTYLLPLVPLVMLFDGVVSCLRSYRPQDLREMIATLPAAEYHWELGEHHDSRFEMPIAYLIGYPRALVTPS